VVAMEEAAPWASSAARTCCACEASASRRLALAQGGSTTAGSIVVARVAGTLRSAGRSRRTVRLMFALSRRGGGIYGHITPRFHAVDKIDKIDRLILDSTGATRAPCRLALGFIGFIVTVALGVTWIVTDMGQGVRGQRAGRLVKPYKL
jgi:hypothetical protein